VDVTLYLNAKSASNMTSTMIRKMRMTVGGGSGTGAGSAPSLVSALPSAASTGSEVYLQPDATNSPAVIWHMRYDGSKWTFLGGTPLLVSGSGNDTVSSTTGAVVPSGSLQVPVDGTYQVTSTASMDSASPTGTGQSFVAPAQPPGVAVSAANGMRWRSDNWSSGARTVQLSLLKGTVSLYAWQANGNARLFERSLSIVPVRIG
jgi:hypothetical protein